MSYDACLEQMGDYQNCSVLYCVLKLYTVISTLEQFLQFSGLDIVSLARFTVPRFICVYVCVFVLSCHAYVLYCIIVTRRSGPGGIEA